jgi:hypothetical protein
MTTLASGDLRSTMEQGGWLDARSVMGYSHDVSQRRRALVGQMPRHRPRFGHASQTPGKNGYRVQTIRGWYQLR